MALTPLVLSLDHASTALDLSSEAGWNQTIADWAVFIRHGTVFGLADGAALVATAAILPYGGFGFVGMVLVTPAFRKRGLATRLLGTAVAALAARDLVPVLDATPEGAVVYTRLGFSTIFDLCRWQRPPSRRDPAPVAAAPFRAPQDLPSHRGLRSAARRQDPREGADQDALDAIVPLDAAVFGSDRRFLLAEFLQRAGTRVVASDRGFVMTRAGHRAVQLGPLVAESEAAAIGLAAAALDGLDGPVFLDVAERCPQITRWLEANGFTRQRPFQRMARGDASGFGHHARVMVTAGPEFG